jgi:hypothetical protein
VYDGGGSPAARQAHLPLTGHAEHFGARAVQTKAPSSMTEAFHRTEAPSSSGSSLAASRISAAVRAGAGRAVPEKRRAWTRRMLVSTTVSRRPKAKEATAAAV